jgi:hypothetical protein
MARRLLGLIALASFVVPSVAAAQTFNPAGSSNTPAVTAQRAASVLPAPARMFGGALAVGNGEVFVGESQNTYRSGFVYVYRKGTSGWAEAAKITAPESALSDGFGAAIALDGTTLLVSATNQNDGRGAVHVYSRGANGTWQRTSELAASDVGEDDRYGASVQIAGDWAFVGAPGQNENLGAVYVFRRGANGAFTQAAKLDPASASAAPAQGQRGGARGGRGGAPAEPERAGFGSALAANGTHLLIGAPGQVAGGGRGRGGRGGRGGGGAGEPAPDGIVYAFTLTGDSWQIQIRDPVIANGVTDQRLKLRIAVG